MERQCEVKRLLYGFLRADYTDLLPIRLNREVRVIRT